VIKISDWMGMRPSVLLDTLSPKATLEEGVAALIEMVPALRTIFENATEAIKAGQASPEIIADIASYAAYKLDLQGVNKGHAQSETKTAESPP